jgi:diacylglycerol O-acyltransferase / wax synthase
MDTLVGKRLRPLTGLDALFLYLESAGTPMHVASLMRLERPKRSPKFAETVREHLLARLSPLPIVRRQLVEAPLALGHPSWREAPDTDIVDHVSIRRLPSPGGEAQLAALLASLHAEPLDRSRPLWQAVVIDGLADGSLALYMKSHHALVDGQAGVQVTQAMVDVEPRPPQRFVDQPAEASAPPPGDQVARAALRATAQQFSRMLRGLPEGIKAVREQARGGDLLGRLRDSVWIAPRTPFNVNVGPKRRVAMASLPMAELKRVAKHFGVSLNDVVMALVSDALRGYLSRRGELPEEPLIAAMPVSLRGEGQVGGNEVSMVQCPLASHIADPVARLHEIAAATRQIKGRVSAFRGLIPTDFPGLAAPIWATGLSHLWQRGRLSERLPALANLVVSNVPGPPIPLYLAGARIRHWFPVSIITHGLGVNLTLLSYADSMECCVVSAPESMDRPASLCSGLRKALDRLLRKVPA